MEIAERPTDTLLDLTPLAAAKVKELMAEEPDAESLVLRVAIQGGGCSGFQYGLGFDSGAAEGDHELVLEGSCGCGHSFQVEEGEELPEGTQMGGCGSGCSH
jgi:Fe-S cluster assembly iron-binding protein IscA